MKKLIPNDVEAFERIKLPPYMKLMKKYLYGKVSSFWIEYIGDGSHRVRDYAQFMFDNGYALLFIVGPDAMPMPYPNFTTDSGERTVYDFFGYTMRHFELQCPYILELPASRIVIVTPESFPSNVNYDAMMKVSTLNGKIKVITGIK